MMDVVPDDPKSWIAIALAGLMGIVTWFTRRKVNEWDERQEEHSVRIRALEVDHITKEDVTALYERIGEIQSQGNAMQIQQNAQHTQLLNTLLSMKKE